MPPSAPDIGAGDAGIVSVVVLTYNEAAYVERCLESVLAFETGRRQLEILVVDGGSTDGTLAIVERLALVHPNLRLVHNRRRIKPVGLNLGITASRGAWILRIDAHSIYPPDYLVRCVEAAERTGAANTGGRAVATVRTPSAGARLVQAVTTHRFGVGDSAFRLGGEEGPVDTVPFGCFRRSALAEVGLFDERLAQTQDYELNCRLRKRGLVIWLLPDLEVRYFNQARYSRFLRKICFQDGIWNPFLWWVAPYAFRLRHAVALAAVTTGLVLAAAALFGHGIFLFGGLVACYLALAIASSVQQALRFRTWWLAPTLPFAFAAYHAAYGLGSLLGCLALATGLSPVQQPWRQRAVNSFRRDLASLAQTIAAFRR